MHFSDEQILACAERARLQEVLTRFGQRLEVEADWETAPWRGQGRGDWVGVGDDLRRLQFVWFVGF